MNAVKIGDFFSLTFKRTLGKVAAVIPNNFVRSLLKIER